MSRFGYQTTRTPSTQVAGPSASGTTEQSERSPTGTQPSSSKPSKLRPSGPVLPKFPPVPYNQPEIIDYRQYQNICIDRDEYLAIAGQVRHRVEEPKDFTYFQPELDEYHYRQAEASAINLQVVKKWRQKRNYEHFRLYMRPIVRGPDVNFNFHFTLWPGCPPGIPPTYPLDRNSILLHADTYKNSHFRCWKLSLWHPFELPDMPLNVTYWQYLDWPYTLLKGKELVLFHFVRTVYYIGHKELTQLLVPNLDYRNVDVNFKIWVPKTCDVGSPFCKKLEKCFLNAHWVAEEFGVPNTERLSAGCVLFFKGLLMGRHNICELYLGRCAKCHFIFCHLDKWNQVCFKCVNCRQFFNSTKVMHDHMRVRGHKVGCLDPVPPIKGGFESGGYPA